MNGVKKVVNYGVKDDVKRGARDRGLFIFDTPRWLTVLFTAVFTVFFTLLFTYENG